MRLFVQLFLHELNALVERHDPELSRNWFNSVTGDCDHTAICHDNAHCGAYFNDDFCFSKKHLSIGRFSNSKEPDHLQCLTLKTSRVMEMVALCCHSSPRFFAHKAVTGNLFWGRLSPPSLSPPFPSDSADLRQGESGPDPQSAAGVRITSKI